METPATRIFVTSQNKLKNPTSTNSNTLATTITSEKESLHNILTIPLKFTYYSCTSPFCLEKRKNVDTGEISFHSRGWWPQRIVCAFITLIDFIWMFYQTRTSLPKESNNPAMYITMFGTMMGAIAKIVLIKKLWRNQHCFEKIPTLITQNFNTFIFQKERWLRGRFVIYLLCAGYSGIILMNLFRAPTVIFVSEGSGGETSTAYFHRWWNKQVERGHTMLFMSVNKNATSEGSSSRVPTIIGILATLGFYHRF